MYKTEEGRTVLILNVKIRQVSVMIILRFTTLALKLGDILIMRLSPIYIWKMPSGY